VTRVGWLDCSSGVSGDMLVAALADAGADVDSAVGAVTAAVGGVRCSVEEVRRGALHARRFVVDVTDVPPVRTLREVRAVLDRVALPPPVIATSHAVFERLADAESRVHGVARDEVHFHELGAVDTIVDVVCACVGFHTLGIDRVVTSPIALGGGTAATEHGDVPVPGPAVVELLRGTALVARGGPVDVELATPTGVALLAELATASGPMPAMQVEAVGVGAGTREAGSGAPNVVRLVVGAAADEDAGAWLLVEANVDDLDPRLWPAVLDRLLAEGAADAWLTPILMKKGRPAHTLSALVPENAVERVRAVMFRETSSIGVRTTVVGKHALDRSWTPVDVDGATIRVKVAMLDGAVVNASPEWDDVAAAAAALGQPVKSVLAKAIAAARELHG
jgi:uncharacterized protein (TIGR00299 family) protein